MSNQQTTTPKTSRQNSKDPSQGANRPMVLHPVIERLFQKRGYSNEDLNEFLSWDLKNLPELTELKDIDKASERLRLAIKNNEKIGIYGDYDVDGTTSCALFYHFFEMLGVKVEMIQPSRFVEGYGLHPSSIDKAQEMGIQVLVTVDCGITNCEAAEYSKMRGLDLIITDHHKDAADEMPDCYAIVNPNRRDEPTDSDRVSLAGVGVAFAIALQIKNDLAKEGTDMPSLYPLLQFVAIGTICDLAKLNPMNIKLVRHGLKQLTQSQYPGILAFFSQEERTKPVSSEKLSFNIGPMINSKGRLDHPERALKLLIAKDSTEAFENYTHLELANKERKFIQAEVVASAKEKVEAQMRGGEHLASIVYDPDWHEGVIGIVASRIVETYKAPAIIFTDSKEEGIIKASARTAGDLSIFDCLKECSDLFLKFGGHHAAAGLSMEKEKLPMFIEKMNSILREIPAIQRTVQEYYDLEVTPEEINPQLVKGLELLEPFGMGNKKPIFKMTKFKLKSYDLLKEIHVRWNLSGMESNKPLKGISFNYIGKWNVPHPEELYEASKLEKDSLTAYFTLGINRFNGNEYIQLMIDKITLGDF